MDLEFAAQRGSNRLPTRQLLSYPFQLPVGINLSLSYNDSFMKILRTDEGGGLSVYLALDDMIFCFDSNSEGEINGHRRIEGIRGDLDIIDMKRIGVEIWVGDRDGQVFKIT